ncbi:DUF3566 domain-containing protein [Corynebacterium otitidis]|uniref:DUF3566 domain-containing protein n=1 Tax=Corynebacterium otitidis ATCC 51513 TaxID=883169 RepID=K0YD72_9CORY|nr:DUF3566 domain-containing protein [Corynebacterium otitidis]EJZ81266.1 hypothetical protein HMPREF9719_01784 [Corynebacterium otitidis ATCC 51513]KKO83818.1 membrane protein [Corynebacterium otitidis]
MATREVVITRIAPASALRVTLAFSLVGLLAWVLAVTLLYFSLDAAGIWDRLNGVIGGVGGEQLVSFGLVISVSAVGGAIVGAVLTLLAPILALIYNAIVDLFGGLMLEVQRN